MAVPTSRETFKDWCLRQLGAGVINVEISDDQAEDQIDFAIAKAQDYHFDFADPQYYKYQITATDVTNGTIPVPANTIGVVEIFDLSSVLFGGGIFNAQYQFVLNNIWNWQNVSLQPYFIGFQSLQFLEQILVGKQPIRYNRYTNVLALDMDWSRVNVGDFIVVRMYASLNQNTATIWADTWLQKYTVALMKKIWGNNLKKYQALPLPNGMTFNGQEIYNEAVAEIQELDDNLIKNYSEPVDIMVG